MREPRPAALLRVELDGDEVSPGHGGAEADAVIGPAGGPALVRRGRVVGVDEIELGLCGDAGKDRVVLPERDAVPAHVGDLQPLPALPGDPRETA